MDSLDLDTLANIFERVPSADHGSLRLVNKTCRAAVDQAAVALDLISHSLTDAQLLEVCRSFPNARSLRTGLPRSLSDVQSMFESLQKLENADLGGGLDADEFPESFFGLSRLKILNMVQVEVKSLGEGFGRFTQLQVMICLPYPY